MKTKKWLFDGDYFDTSLTIPNTELELSLDIIVKNTGISRQPELVKESLRCILANLYINLQLDRPTMISLNMHDWTKSKQPDILWSSYNTVSKLLNELYKLKYMDRAKGYWIKDKEIGYTGKYWLLPDTDLIELLDECRVKKITDVYNTIKLRHRDGYSVKYRNNNRQVKSMKRSLRIYNSNLINTHLTYSFKLQDLFDDKPERFEGRFKKIATLVNTGQITLTINNVNINKISIVDNVFFLRPDHSYRSIKKTEDRYYRPEDWTHITNIADNILLPTNITTVYTIPNDIRYINTQHNSVVIRGEIHNKSLFRVFNRASLKFDFGGRFYNDAFQNMSKVIRKSFSIDGENVVSLDYSGMHIRACYHLLGQEYLGECYVYHKGENDYRRNQIKYASLITINAENRGQGLWAIMEELKIKKLSLPLKDIDTLVSDFENYHKPIQQFLFSDIGIKLQYYDSLIMNNILSILYDRGIIALPIHDEVICQSKYKDFVLQVMSNEYEKVMNFLPIID